MYTIVVEKSPGRKIERKQYVVLIEKEVPNLVLADSDFSMPDYSDGWTWNIPVNNDKCSKVVAESQTGGEDLSSMTYSVPALVWSVSQSLTHLTKVKNDLLAENHETISAWSFMTDNLDPTPVGLTTTMSTSIDNYHVHLESDSVHASQY